MSAKKPMPLPPGKRRGKLERDPNSKRQQRIAGRTDENLSAAAKAFRDEFITQYLIDFCAAKAYRRAGGKATGRKLYDTANELTSEPYVASRVQQAIDDAENGHIINRNRILAGLVREANYHGTGAQHGARVTAYGKLAQIMRLGEPGEEETLAAAGGVLVVPATEKPDDWARRSAQAQADLLAAVRK